MKLLTGNDLPTGDVTWWTGNGWSRHVEDAADVADKGDAIAKAEEGARRVNGPYVIDATQTDDGPRPAHIKDRIRALGPTVRPDLTLKPTDPAAGSWVNEILPGTGRGTARSVVEGVLHQRSICGPPLHQLRWFPSSQAGRN